MDGPVVLHEGLVRFQDQVGEHLPPLPVDRDGVLVVPPAHHIRRGDVRELLHGPVPGDDLPLQVDGERGVRQEVDDIRKALLRLLERQLCAPPVHRLPYLVGQLCELRDGVPSLLKVEVRTFVQCLYGYLLAATAGEEDEGDVAP